MEKENISAAILQLQRVFDKLLKDGFTEQEMKAAAANAMINAILDAKSAEEKIDFLLNSDFFWDSYFRKNASESNPEAILKKYNANSEEWIRKLEEQRKNAKYAHTFRDFLEE